MSLTWLKNMAGMKLSDEEMMDIPQPEIELFIHVATKTLQLGSTVGAIASTISFVRNRSKGWEQKVLRHHVLRKGFYSAAIGLALGGPMLYMKKIDTTEGYYDRSYRLRHNKGQVLADRWTYVFGGVGLLVGGLNGLAPGVLTGLVGSQLIKYVTSGGGGAVKKAADEEDGSTPKGETDVKKVDDSASADKRSRARSRKSKPQVDAGTLIVGGGTTGGLIVNTVSCKCKCHIEEKGKCQCFDRPLKKQGKITILPLKEKPTTAANCKCDCHETCSKCAST